MKHINKSKALNKFNSSSLITIILVILAHLLMLLFVLITSRYYALQLQSFLSAIGFVLIIFLILDIIFFISFKYSDNKLKIVSIIMSSILVVLLAIASFYVLRINKSVDDVLDNQGDEQFEKVAGTFVSYKKEFNDLNELSGKKVGILYESNEGTGSIGQEELKNKNVEPLIVQFNTMDDLLFGLVEEEIDAAIFPSSYRQRYANEEEVDFDRFLDDLHDFYSFEKEIKTGENQGQKIDISSEPFNILLIGFAPENADNSYGLSDTIMIATVNPKSMKVALTSIARDSFVPITCYNGAKDKINAARGNSRACLLDTVNDLMDTDINLYMEVNFQGVVDIVDALGGVSINNPVTFVGQTPSSKRGEMRVLVPEGNCVATGEQALAFARERHAMPNGDFDRQLHQQEVVKNIAKRLIELKDVNAALKVLEAAGNNISTNLSLTQLTGIFNYILNVKNYTGFQTSNLIEIDNMRVTGYPSWTYNYSLRLPLWIYKLYNGSITEAKNYINRVLGNIPEDEVLKSQERYHRFFVNFPYYPETIYSETFDEPQVHEKMPDFVPLLTNYSYEDALAWANSMGVSLSVTTINQGDSGFDANLQGRIIDQSPRQGALVMENPVVYITRMGFEKREITIDCTTYDEAIALANRYGLNTSVVFVANDGNHNPWDLSYTEPGYGTTLEEGTFDTLRIYVYGCPAGQELDENGACYVHEHVWGDWEVVSQPTCTENGQERRICQTNNNHIDYREIPTSGHNMEFVNHIVLENGDQYDEYKCSVCGVVEQWNYQQYVPDTPPENTEQ